MRARDPTPGQLITNWMRVRPPMGIGYPAYGDGKGRSMDTRGWG